MPPILRLPAVLSLLGRLLHYPPPVRLLALTQSRSLHLKFYPDKISPQLIPPVDFKMLDPLLVSKGGNWTLSTDGFALERDVMFGSFSNTKVR